MTYHIVKSIPENLGPTMDDNDEAILRMPWWYATYEHALNKD